MRIPKRDIVNDLLELFLIGAILFFQASMALYCYSHSDDMFSIVRNFLQFQNSSECALPIRSGECKMEVRRGGIPSELGCNRRTVLSRFSDRKFS